MRTTAILLGALLLAGCSPANKGYIEQRAESRWRELGFEVVGYDGFNWGGTLPWDWRYGGASVWYVLRRVPDNGITYGGYLWRWGDELHMYSLRAYDAVRPQ